MWFIAFSLSSISQRCVFFISSLSIISPFLFHLWSPHFRQHLTVYWKSISSLWHKLKPEWNLLIKALSVNYPSFLHLCGPLQCKPSIDVCLQFIAKELTKHCFELFTTFKTQILSMSIGPFNLSTSLFASLATSTEPHTEQWTDLYYSDVCHVGSLVA